MVLFFALFVAVGTGILFGLAPALDQVVALNERHLKRLLSEYVRYHHEDRTHLGLEKETPEGRLHSEASGPVLSQERLEGLHHRYNRAA